MLLKIFGPPLFCACGIKDMLFFSLILTSYIVLVTEEEQLTPVSSSHFHICTCSMHCQGAYICHVSQKCDGEKIEPLVWNQHTIHHQYTPTPCLSLIVVLTFDTGFYAHIGFCLVGTTTEQGVKCWENTAENERYTPTLDGYEMIFRLSYLDSGPRISFSSLLCLIYSWGATLSTSWMMDRNFTQFRSSVWLIRLPVA